MFSNQLNKYKYLSMPIIRFYLGIIFLLHGSQKLFGAFGGPGLEGFSGFVAQLGFPSFFGILVAIIEFFGGIMLIFGLFTRYAAALTAIVMFVATWKFHLKNGFFLSNGGYEFTLTLLLLSIALVFYGAGEISLDKLLFRKKLG